MVAPQQVWDGDADARAYAMLGTGQGDVCWEARQDWRFFLYQYNAQGNKYILARVTMDESDPELLWVEVRGMHSTMDFPQPFSAPTPVRDRNRACELAVRYAVLHHGHHPTTNSASPGFRVVWQNTTGAV